MNFALTRNKLMTVGRRRGSPNTTVTNILRWKYFHFCRKWGNF